MKPFAIGSLYRPPNSDISQFNSDLLTILNDLTRSKHRLAFLADFNLNLLNADRHAPTGEFLTNLQSFNFTPTTRNPTRISDISATLIDNIFVNNAECEYRSAIVYSDISDHLPVVLHFSQRGFKSHVMRSNATKRYFDPKNIGKFNSELADENWDSVYSMIDKCEDPNVAFNEFSVTYRAAFDKYFPEKIVKCSNRMTPRHDWMTKGLMRSCMKKSKLYRKYCKNRTKRNKDNYLAYRNKLKKLIRLSETRYYKEKFNSLMGNTRETWKLLDSVLNKNRECDISNFFVENDVEITDKTLIVKKFNEYFSSIGSQLAAAIPVIFDHVIFGLP
jgi:hypothetical protein